MPPPACYPKTPRDIRATEDKTRNKGQWKAQRLTRAVKSRNGLKAGDARDLQLRGKVRAEENGEAGTNPNPTPFYTHENQTRRDPQIRERKVELPATVAIRS